jgi:hypothetical protein
MSTPEDSAAPSEGHEPEVVETENQEQEEDHASVHDADSASNEESGDDDSEYEDEEEEEPKLRYNRIKSSVTETLAKDAASVLRVSMRFVVSAE